MMPREFRSRSRVRQRLARQGAEAAERHRAAERARNRRQLQKLCVATLLLGVVGVLYGLRETFVATRSSADPVPVDVASLEAGRAPPDPHLRLGPHLVVWSAAVYEIDSRHADGRSAYDPEAPLSYVIAPIVSLVHPWARRALTGGSFPSTPVPGSVALFLRTWQFETVGDIPKTFQRFSSREGLLEIETPGSIARAIPEALTRTWPHATQDRILSDGKHPTTALAGIGILLLGILLAGGSLAGFAVISRTGRRGRR